MRQQQRWRRLGQVLEPKPAGDWWNSHASYPTTLARDDGLIDVYFSVRDSRNRSSMTRITLDIFDEGFEVIDEHGEPLLRPGARGAFDADGVTVGSVIRTNRQLYAYYLGWSAGGSVPFTNFIGLAIAGSNRSEFSRYLQVPILGRSKANPLTLGYPWVIHSPADGFQMWFGTHLAWGVEGLQMKHVIKTARSSDGLRWKESEQTAIPLLGDVDPAEFAISRPSVLREPTGTYSMWYARRRPKYEIGFARSQDGENWHRDDAAFTLVGDPGDWESQEQTYPCVFDHRKRRFMLYNGDGYGRTGFGLAVLENYP